MPHRCCRSTLGSAHRLLKGILTNISTGINQKEGRAGFAKIKNPFFQETQKTVLEEKYVGYQFEIFNIAKTSNESSFFHENEKCF